MNEMFEFLKEKDFKELADVEKWKLIQVLKKQMEQLQIEADKNCKECSSRMLTVSDVNIEMFFEDWRVCSDNCKVCNKKDRSNMCDLQFQIMSHIANSLLDLEKKQNLLTELVMKRDDSGSKILQEFVKDKKASKLNQEEMYR